MTINGPRGGVPESNCTIDETNGVRFTTTGQSTTQRIHIEAREKGSCRVEPSYSNFHITFGGAITGSGVMWLGQIQGGGRVHPDVLFGKQLRRHRQEPLRLDRRTVRSEDRPAGDDDDHRHA